MTATVLAIAGGGAAGALARALADPASIAGGEASLTVTLLINLAGALMLGVVVGHGLPRLSPAWREGITTGFLGSFTTYSALSTWWLGLTGATGVLAAYAYLASSLILGVAAAWGGLSVGRRWRGTAATPGGKS